MSRPPPAPTPHKPDTPEILARVSEGMELVEFVIRTMRRELGLSLSQDEMRSYGQEALLRAARSFDAERGVPFKRWANLRIRGAIIDGIRTQQLPRRLYERLRAIEAAGRVQEALLEEDAAAPPRDAEAADRRLDDYLSSMATALAVGLIMPTANDDLDQLQNNARTPEEELQRAQLMEAVRQAMTARPDAERTLLERHYLDGLTFEEAARELGLSKSWASRLHARAIEGMVKDLKRRRVEQ
jgi:RNA polymerase sigma factor for flagellar operon FliA